MMNDGASRDRPAKTLLDRARRYLVGGVNSPVRSGRAVGCDPFFVSRAEGPFVFDGDGVRHIDLVGSWGTAIVGHAHPAVVDAVTRAAKDGLSFGACCAAEADLAEIICGAIPSVERIRFVSSGTEATMSAIRLARAATGRKHIVKFIGCYHGHVDSLLVSAGSGAATHGEPDSAGVPECLAATTLLAPFNDLPAVERVMRDRGERVAAILAEPIAGNMGMVEPLPGFLEGLRALCDRHGSLLIFDEVMTGFRVAWGGFQTICGVRPDLTCLGKVIGGGMPVAAYGGRAELMSQVSPLGPVYQAGTLSGNPIGMAAGIATLRICAESGFYDRLQARANDLTLRLAQAGRSAGIPLSALARGGMMGLSFCGSPPRNFDDARAADHAAYAKFYRTMLERRVWLPPSSYEALFLSAAHDERVCNAIVDAARESFQAVDG